MPRGLGTEGKTQMSNVNVMDAAAATSLSKEERDLLHELVCALRSIRYGSIALTVHDGRLVEIHKTEKIRRKHLA
jgi:hypothetical protein